MRVLILTTLCLLCFYSQGSEDEKVSAVIDSLHQYAAQAKFNEYFELYSAGATFIGTDASETWTLEEFKNYAKPVFDRGSGWTYKSRERHIYFSPKWWPPLRYFFPILPVTYQKKSKCRQIHINFQ